MIKIVFIAFLGVIASMLLKKVDSNLSFAVAIITGIIIISLLYGEINSIVMALSDFSSGYGVSDVHIKLLVKVLGISYVTQLGVSIAEECGEKFIAKKVELGGKILIVSLSVPVLFNLLDNIIGLL